MRHPYIYLLQNVWFKHFIFVNICYLQHHSLKQNIYITIQFLFDKILQYSADIFN